jgi:6-phosphogluconolactonase
MKDRGRISIDSFAGREALTTSAAEAIADKLCAGLSARGRAGLVVTGGRTPGPLYDRLSDTALDWANVTITLSDERWVDTNSDDSNERLVRQRLLQGKAAAAQFIPLMSGEPTPDAAAASASARLAEFPRAPDVVLLGMGEDGHIASLFPGNPALALGLDMNGSARCIAVPQGEPAPPGPRLSLTLPVLCGAETVMILATGATKRAVFETAMTQMGAPKFPVSHLLQQCRCPVRFLWAE